MNLSDFTQNETEILEGIQKKGLAARETGLIRGVPEQDSSAGYLVALRYSEYDRGCLERFSHRFRQSINGRAITYGLDNAHQTIVDYGLKNITGDFMPDKQILDKLVQGTREGFEIARNQESPGNSFGDLVPSSDSVILRPLRPDNGTTYDLIENVVRETSKLGIKPRGARGRHMTANRFTEDIPPEEMDDFNNLMWRGDVLYQAYPNASNDGDWLSAEKLDVGYFTINKEGFEFTPVESFKF